MEPLFAQSLLQGLSFYLLAGLVFGLVFVTALIRSFDANAAEAAPIQFRLLIFPGVVALWPILLLLLISRRFTGSRS